jgi:alpha-L-rhamnosidase
VLRFAETLNPDGTIYTANLGAAWATDTYVLKGDGEEVWQPRFTYHGFRYVEMTGYPGRPTAEAVTGVAVGSNIPLTGSFECSNPMVSRSTGTSSGRSGRTSCRCPPTARSATSG